MEKVKRPKWTLLLAIGLAGLFLYLALRGMDWGEFVRVVSQGHYEILLIAMVLISANCVVRALRWRLLVTAGAPASVPTVFWATMIGYLGNSYLPARAGELMRAVALGKKTGAGTSFTLATALVERVMDVFALILVSALSIRVLPEIPPAFASAAGGIAAVAGVGLFVLLIVPRLEKQIQALLKWAIRKEAWAAKIEGWVERFLEGMRVLQDPKRAGLFLGLTAVIWLVDGIIAILVAQVIGKTLGLPQALLLLAGMGLSSAIPSTPGYIGVYQFVAVTILGPFGFSQSEAIADILVMQAATYLVVTLWGLIGLWKMK